MSLKRVRKEIINKIRRNPEKSGLRYKDYGKSIDFAEYSDEEIEEMFYGVYKDTKHLLVDGDYFINLNDVIQTGCTLEEVTYYKNPTKEDLKDNSHNTIQNIRTFYIKDYFLITQDKVNGTDKHKITRYLWKTGAINAGRSRFPNYIALETIIGLYKDLKKDYFQKTYTIPSREI